MWFGDWKYQYQGVIDLSPNTHLSAPRYNAASPTTPVPQPKSKQVPRDVFDTDDVVYVQGEPPAALFLRLTR